MTNELENAHLSVAAAADRLGEVNLINLFIRLVLLEKAREIREYLFTECIQ
jgi:hypothetical protein